ncbi:hypothetical protein V496_08167 [Pseudogymnoascus sp. VKM F-4515 (FW-2607)]|nr:hypothetical protein V496_08167 [Pseudogymnoascus sp. VKM F-4515 (FW-2607)]KFY68990.1 hypothetical protein V498_10535 [Pseudogymnoascus sp. VKM F-4517 (FW-2822)]
MFITGPAAMRRQLNRNASNIPAKRYHNTNETEGKRREPARGQEGKEEDNYPRIFDSIAISSKPRTKYTQHTSEVRDTNITITVSQEKQENKHPLPEEHLP